MYLTKEVNDQLKLHKTGERHERDQKFMGKIS